MTGLMDDVRSLLSEQGVPVESGHLPGILTSDVLYADDTLCFSSDASTLEKILHAIETVSAQYGLRLNKRKCELLSFNSILPIHFLDGSAVKGAAE
eukprot:9869402-Prorocentrum_lima.AAC.1